LVPEKAFLGVPFRTFYHPTTFSATCLVPFESTRGVSPAHIGPSNACPRAAPETTPLWRLFLQYYTAEWKPAFLRQAREFLFFPLLPSEASK